MKKVNLFLLACMLWILVPMSVLQATTVYFNTTAVGTSVFHGTNVDAGNYRYWQYNLGLAPVSVSNQTVYLTFFSPSGNDCINPPSGEINILTYGPNQPVFGTYGLTVPVGFGFSRPTPVSAVAAPGGCYVTYAFDGAHWDKPTWNQNDWVVIETGGTDLATDPTAPISSPYNNNAVDVNIRGAWACMTDDGNYLACLPAHFTGYNPPVNNDGSGKYNFGRTLPVKFQLTDENGDVTTNAIATIVVTSVHNGVVGSTPVNLGSSQFTVSDNQYIYNLDTSKLAIGTWQIKVLLDDGTTYPVLITLR